MNLDNIPGELKYDPQWVPWKFISDEKGKDRKLPIDPKTGKTASISDPKTWGSFDEACARMKTDNLDGLNIALTKNGKKYALTGLDFDHCVGENGDVSSWALDIVKQIDSYTEYSPSKTGLRILVNTDGLPPGGRKNGDVEIYDDKHFLSVTGDRVPNTPDWVSYRPDQVIEVWQKFIGGNGETKREVTDKKPSLTDDEILEKLSKAKNFNKFNKLNKGDWQVDYPSQSEADLALCNILAFYSQNIEQIDRLFRQSGLIREKWDTRRGESTYGQDTILNALSQVRETYRHSVDKEYIYTYLDDNKNVVSIENFGGNGKNETYSNSNKIGGNANNDNSANKDNNDNKNTGLLTSANKNNRETQGGGMGTERDLLLDVRQWVELGKGIFKTQDIINELDIRGREEKTHLYVILGRLCDKGIIETTGLHRGTYRRIEKFPQVQNWRASSGALLPVQIPLGIHELAKIQKGNTILLEGGKSQGKTTFALEFARLNRNLFPGQRICYQNIEMSDDEIKLKLGSYPSEIMTEDEWDEAVEFMKVTEGWQDFIKPDGVNIVDYLVNYEKAYLIAQDIYNIHKKLRNGIALVLVQRDPFKPYANGGGQIRNIPRLCISIVNHIVKLEDVKSWAPGVKECPTGLQRKYKQVEWWKLSSHDPWTQDNIETYSQTTKRQKADFIHEN